MNRSVVVMAVLLAILLAAGAVRAAEGTIDRDIEVVASDGVKLRGFASIPDDSTATGSVRRPLVVLIHPADRNRDSMIPLANALVRRGFATLLMDTRGYGKSRSTDKLMLYTFPVVPIAQLRRAADDQERILVEAAKGVAFDAERVAFVGVGQGALIAAEAAARSPRAKAMVLVDLTDPVAGFDPPRDLGLYGGRPALLVCSAFPPSRERLMALTDYGTGERNLTCVTAFETNERLVREGSEAEKLIVDWLGRTFGLPEQETTTSAP